jgi:diadenosine tetraphosphatase ApaH/serine/threonine PP2A family protein phosphatase
MRVLVVSDIHGNVHALEAVLAAAGAVDALWNLGDAVGYGAFPNEVLHLLRERSKLNVRGNHDRACCGLMSTETFNPVAATAAQWTRDQLTNENLRWLREWPQGPLCAGEHALCVHGSPLDEDHYITTMRDAWRPLQKMGRDLAFFGHTHLQGAFSQREEEWQEEHPVFAPEGGAAEALLEVAPGSRHLINPGSVGQPRDLDWRAAYAIYEAEQATVEFHRVPYDVSAAQAAIRRAGLPERLASRLAQGR